MPIFIYTPAQLLRIGLKLLKVDPHKLKTQSYESRMADFKGHYGTQPIVLARMWEDLQTILHAPLKATRPENLNSGANIKYFLRAAHFLMRYQTEVERKVATGNTQKTVRKWTWFFLEKICELRDHKIVWPDSWSTNFIISLDGVHCRFPDPKHPTLSKDPSFYSHKSNSAGLAYELALALFEPKLVWLKGPLPAGANNDMSMYQAHLKNLIPDGKIAVTDGGYPDRRDPKLAQPKMASRRNGVPREII